MAPLRAARVQKNDERRPSRDTRGGGAASRPVPRPLQSRSHASRGAGTVVDPRATLAEDGAEVSPPSRSRLASVRHEGGVAGRERRRGRIDGGGRHALHAHGAGRGVHRGVQERGPRRRRPRAHHVRENPSLPSQHRARAGRPDRTRGDEVRPRRRRRPRRLATPPGHHTVRHAGAMPDVRRRGAQRTIGRSGVGSAEPAHRSGRKLDRINGRRRRRTSTVRRRLHRRDVRRFIFRRRRHRGGDRKRRAGLRVDRPEGRHQATRV